MNKFKIAKSVSGITNPPIICIPLFLIICATLSYTSGVFNFQKFFILEIVSLVFASLLPLAIILFWAKRLGTDRDISNRSDRHMPLLIGILFFNCTIAMLLDKYLCCTDNHHKMENKCSHNRTIRSGCCFDFTFRSFWCCFWCGISDSYLVKSSFKKTHLISSHLRRSSGILFNCFGDAFI